MCKEKGKTASTKGNSGNFPKEADKPACVGWCMEMALDRDKPPTGPCKKGEVHHATAIAKFVTDSSASDGGNTCNCTICREKNAENKISIF